VERFFRTASSSNITMAILEISNLNAGYGKAPVLYDISMEIDEGTISTILGPNGSGKSTLLKTIFGLTSLYEGSIKFKGVEISREKPHEIARLGISYMTQSENLYSKLTIKENLVMAGYLLSKTEMDKRVKEVLEIMPMLPKFLRKHAYMLSGGERQMAAMSMALMRQPALLMFDEPSASLAQRATDEVFTKIKELQDMGKTIILVEQNTKKALNIAENAYLLVSGRLNYHGKSHELIANKEFGRLFLGL